MSDQWYVREFHHCDNNEDPAVTDHGPFMVRKDAEDYATMLPLDSLVMIKGDIDTSTY